MGAKIAQCRSRGVVTVAFGCWLPVPISDLGAPTNKNGHLQTLKKDQKPPGYR
jgi:hypothetical protein